MTTEELLVEWGIWLNQADSGMRGYRSPALDMVRSGGRLPPGLPAPAIDDAQGTEIDQLVAVLMKHDEHKGQSLVMYYAWRKSIRQMASHLGIDKNKVQQIIQNAVSWIDGARHKSL